MYEYSLHEQLNALLKNSVDISARDNLFYTRFIANIAAIKELFDELYATHPSANSAFEKLLQLVTVAYNKRSASLKQRDLEKDEQGNWFLSNKIAGMSLYVDRFCGNLQNLEQKLDYFDELGVNLLHLMPVFESPENESDGGYAVSNFRQVDERFGTLNDLQQLQKNMQQNDMYLMLDIVLNHTSHKHEWAQKAKEGNAYYQDYFYFFDDRTLPDEYEKTMPEIFPEAAPGSFTYVEELQKWVMSVFHNYQWDLNYKNPFVLVDMLDNIFFYANIGVDILRIDAPAFIWKEIGTTCQNLKQAHTLLRLIKQCVQVATPGMALLGEAIVAPNEIMKYFGTGAYKAKECDVAYNATHMALQWDALASGNTKVMLQAQHELLRKPKGTTWINYTRCHDDIGLGYDDYMIENAGFNAYLHRTFIKNYYAGIFPGSTAKGALFSSNPRTGDARISGSLASLCGLEKAIEENDPVATDTAIKRILLMQAHTFFLGGIPMLFYGDEAAYTNDYSYLKDAGKSYDNRWMHRPVIDWQKNKKVFNSGTIEHLVYSGTQSMLKLRSSLDVFADHSNIEWLHSHNVHVAGFIRSNKSSRLFCMFNFHKNAAFLTWYAFKEKNAGKNLYDHWRGKNFTVGEDHEYFVMEPYGFYILEEK